VWDFGYHAEASAAMVCEQQKPQQIQTPDPTAPASIWCSLR